jgi:Photosynthesis system II assembly factor YCF48/Putative zinc-finger
MNEGLPKLVVERLRTAEPGTHPDADLLTAFAEKTLSSRERDSVLQHLAACADCREIVALATPEQVVAPPPLPSRTSWLTWPYVRWGAALACVVVVGAAVTLRQQKHASQAKLASTKVEETAGLQQSYEARNEVSSAKQVDQYVSRTLEGSKKDNDVKRSDTISRIQPSSEATEKKLTLQARNYGSRDELNLVHPPADNAPARAKEQIAAGMVAASPASTDDKAELDQRQYSKMVPAPMAPSSETVTVAGEAVQTQAESASAQKLQSQYSFGAKRAIKSATASNLGKLADAGGATNLVSATPPLAARWTLSPEGMLQRSLDSGMTWTQVTVAPNLALRAVSASGSEVWVGGAGGALFHSSDNGMHWTQVRPSFEGRVLTGDIIGVEFRDLAHGQLTTTYEIWTTNDAGKTWSRTQK